MEFPVDARQVLMRSEGSSQLLTSVVVVLSAVAAIIVVCQWLNARCQLIVLSVER